MVDILQSKTHSSHISRALSLISKGKEFSLPAFVRSVSSYETPLVRPDDALLALHLHPSSAPILISSFDLSQHGASYSYQDRAPNLMQFRRLLQSHDERGRIIFLDSGNYESYRLKRGATDESDEDKIWLPKHHLEVLNSEEAVDFTFSFDQQSMPGPATSKADRIIEWCGMGQTENPAIPIIHAAHKSNGKVNFRDLGTVINRVVSELNCDVIAVPERDLGDGITERIKAVRKIRRILNNTGRYRLLHLLGTGNPYTILLLAAAGADLFDGLEWCRLAVDAETGRLHHPHHFDMFWSRMKFSEYDAVRDLFTSSQYPSIFKMLIHNLDFFDSWMKELRLAVHGGHAEQMLRSYMGTGSFLEAETVFESALHGELGND